jgi:hypothetical protein
LSFYRSLSEANRFSSHGLWNQTLTGVPYILLKYYGFAAGGCAALQNQALT